MNLEDFYRGRGEDYPVIIGRFMGNENLLKKFVKNFPDDPTYGRLCEAMEAKDWPQVEMSAHTLKGVAANLSFSKLFQASADLVSVIREQETEKADGLFSEVQKAYKEVVQGNIRAGLNLGKEYGSRKADAFDR
ncbi:Hpt domain-containing protein [Anaerostipes caccae]|uniref:Hpt domain-containing protein n=3 Tax=Anaerostipes TaxID=207244 RepID=UPI001D064F29|nr:Hpt domain-containing protein [Anaerostipes caccae]MCB6296683.1 Hpt domain-containing protein [Anaerostipes caccae]MCB6338113.1 Hpt domain-containing protein [Anaerostipes caccae]MCB6352963.1 Hpt domain-containing protein [Anaerostipes caccae]MCB6358412.1 Hpt domain-containing protein [Anaerostipes caccae]MCB6361519.1 Hpt domain-containing protein [Anaerostipes caccae]